MPNYRLAPGNNRQRGVMYQAQLEESEYGPSFHLERIVRNNNAVLTAMNQREMRETNVDSPERIIERRAIANLFNRTAGFYSDDLERLLAEGSIANPV